MTIELLIIPGDQNEVDTKVDIYATPKKANDKSLP